MTNSHAVSHPSEPNYLALFAGSTFGVKSDHCPLTYDAPNAASELAKAGVNVRRLFRIDAERRLHGMLDETLRAQTRAVGNFTNVPASANLVYRGLPAQMPSLMFVTPNMCNDMHDCSTGVGDTWLSQNLPRLSLGTRKIMGC